MPSDQPAQTETDAQEPKREVQHDLNKVPHFSDADPNIQVSVNADGHIMLSTNKVLDLEPPGERPARDEFWERQTGELRSLAETADESDVRRAALALLRYAEGATMKEAVETTPYGIGWLRGLRACVKEEGVEGLRSRDYRAPRAESSQRG